MDKAQKLLISIAILLMAACGGSDGTSRIEVENNINFPTETKGQGSAAIDFTATSSRKSELVSIYSLDGLLLATSEPDSDGRVYFRDISEDEVIVERSGFSEPSEFSHSVSDSGELELIFPLIFPPSLSELK